MSKKNKIKTQEEDSHDYKFTNTASLWNQLRIAWKEYHSIKKIQKQTTEKTEAKKPEDSKNQKTSSDKQLLGIETLIDNLLSGLKLPTSNNIKQLFDMTVENVDGLEFYYGEKDERKNS